ncbi:conserved protein of unknown function [Candidatus Hydrogenisulfobacillus filiaventi]|uniref:Segregation and condensation protein A n=1 Tax=Candidatus Hydrogenisulfobacillus filiaventi TaxID=2707344 RepID=A0A6F8ZG68_9FIRM|nr:hypothetical protein [Bacillota bacterium]CAB1128697.1 conserved protein of unknown function [Candidatus Hydrogenisulfobacillus filiaventi]
MSAGTPVGMTPVDGELAGLARQLKAQPHKARDLVLRAVVARATRRWRTAPDPLAWSDEMPLCAWMVKRKSQAVLPGAEADEEPSAPPEPAPDPLPWRQAGAALAALAREGARLRYRPPAPPRQPPPVAGADPARLAAAFPRLRPRPLPPPRVVVRPPLLLPDVMARLEAALAAGGIYDLEALCPALNLCSRGERGARAAVFLAAVVLWHQGRITARQSEPFGPIRLEGRRPGERG